MSQTSPMAPVPPCSTTSSSQTVSVSPSTESHGAEAALPLNEDGQHLLLTTVATLGARAGAAVLLQVIATCRQLLTNDEQDEQRVPASPLRAGLSFRSSPVLMQIDRMTNRSMRAR